MPASTFLLGAEREYSRDDGTPTRDAFETVVGDLEDAQAIAFSSGMAAIAAVFDLLAVGAQIVWPATKHLGGHSDLLCGVATTRRPELAKALRKQRELRGATPGTLEAYLATRGIRTYPLRAATAAASAQELARRLEADPRVELVRYPGLPSHPTHDAATQNRTSFGSIISFDVVGGATAADRMCERVQVVRHATSFGAVESTIERRAAIPGQQHLPPGLLRLSVGIEHIEDLWEDLDQAL